MIFHIPTDTELVSTDVAYQVPLYDENDTYKDGDEVRKDDDNVYTVTNYSEDIPYKNYVDYMYYEYDSKFNIEGTSYKKIDDSWIQGCWLDAGTAASDAYSVNGNKVKFDLWDGNTFDTGISTDDSEYCPDGYTLVFHQESVSADKTKVKLSIYNSDNNLTKTIYFDLYNEVVPLNGGLFIKDNGYVSILLGYDSAHVTGYGVQNNRYVQLSENYYVINKHRLDYIRPTVKKIPFDTKQYTSVSVNGSQTWKIKPRGYHSNAVVIGGVKGRMLTVMFMNSSSEIIAMKQIDLTINKLTSTQLRDNGNPVEIGDGSVEASTQIVYLPLETTPYYVEIKVDDQAGLGSEIGWIMATSFIDVGATNLEFTHDIKNFDKNKVSEVSGYIDHIKGQRVVQHKGSFDIPLTDYDKMLMINKRFTQELIAIDGSDTTANEASDSQNRFQSTKLIGRVKRLGMQTRTKQNKLDDTQTITFEFEEVV